MCSSDLGGRDRRDFRGERVAVLALDLDHLDGGGLVAAGGGGGSGRGGRGLGGALAAGEAGASLQQFVLFVRLILP